MHNLWCCKVGMTERCQGLTARKIDGIDLLDPPIPEHCYRPAQRNTALLWKWNIDPDSDQNTSLQSLSSLPLSQLLLAQLLPQQSKHCGSFAHLVWLLKGLLTKTTINTSSSDIPAMEAGGDKFRCVPNQMLRLWWIILSLATSLVIFYPETLALVKNSSQRANLSLATSPGWRVNQINFIEHLLSRYNIIYFACFF